MLAPVVVRPGELLAAAPAARAGGLPTVSDTR
jgi:hypothetical protein